MPVAIKPSLALLAILLPDLLMAAAIQPRSPVPDGLRLSHEHRRLAPALHQQPPVPQPPADGPTRPAAPPLLAEQRPDLPVPAPGDDCAHLAAGNTFELPVLSTLFHPTWDDLSEQQQAILAPFAPEWNTWPMAEKRSWLAFADRMQSLPEAQRRRAHRRILEWANMSPEERRIARINYQNSRRHPMPERVREWEQYRALSWSQRQALREAEAAEREAAARHNGLPRHPANPIPGQHPDDDTQGTIPMDSLRTIIRQSWYGDDAPAEAVAAEPAGEGTH